MVAGFSARWKPGCLANASDSTKKNSRSHDLAIGFPLPRSLQLADALQGGRVYGLQVPSAGFVVEVVQGVSSALWKNVRVIFPQTNSRLKLGRPTFSRLLCCWLV